MPEQYTIKRLMRSFEVWFARAAAFARGRKRWWASDRDNNLTRDMPPPRARGPSEQLAAGPPVSKQDKKSGSSQCGKKRKKKDSNAQLPQGATGSKKDTGEAKGPGTHIKS